VCQAADLAARCDASLVCVRGVLRWEGEACDRPYFDLPGRQTELIEAVAAANGRTAVVLTMGSPVPMPWIDKVGSVVLALNPGMEGGTAIARALTGAVNPSGKLPFTLPKRIEDTPAYGFFPGGKDQHYGEGIFVGYRWYDTRGIEPLFPFGHGGKRQKIPFSFPCFRAHVKRVSACRPPGTEKPNFRYMLTGHLQPLPDSVRRAAKSAKKSTCC
jgi:beta-glucosidase